MHDRPVPWRWIFRRLSGLYGWTPDQIGQLTLPQLFTYLDGSNDSGVAIELPPDEAVELVRQRQQQKSAWIEDQLRRIFTTPQAE